VPGLLHLAQFVLELPNFVSKPSGKLKLELFGRVTHLLIQINNYRHNLVLGHSGYTAF
jgi:hypothetical protein